MQEPGNQRADVIAAMSKLMEGSEDMPILRDDPSKCLYCGEKMASVHNMIQHLKHWHLGLNMYEPGERILCGCGEKINSNQLTAHLSGRPGSGITSDPLTMQEIADHIWVGYNLRVLGKQK